jgi:predicted CoA-substrate-specific enzyme activase
MTHLGDEHFWPRRQPDGNGVLGGPERLFCGVDVGASATKLVLLNEQATVRARTLLPSGVDYVATARECRRLALAAVAADPRAVARCVATGYGRHNVDYADVSLTEIHCHGAGSYHSFPGAITVVDIGGQDNKVIRLEAAGQRAEFKMNRKCAAGTGAFLEEIALRLGLDLSTMDGLAGSTEEAVKLSSFCTVFAKTEILAHLRQGIPVARIVRGAFLSVVTRVMEMDPLTGEVVLTGGVVAHNPTIAAILSEKLGRPVRVPPYPQFTGALGAALTARGQFASAQAGVAP